MTKIKEAPTKEYFVLPKETIFVRYVKRQTGFVVNDKHVAYGGKLEGAIDTLSVKMDRNGSYVPILTGEEEAGLEDLMSVDKGYLSVHKPKDNYWDSITIPLTKEGVSLNLSKLNDFIAYKVLLTYEDYVSPSILETRKKKSYKYEIVRVKDIDDKNKSSVNYDIKAYKLFGKIEDSNEQMAGIIRVLTNKSVSATNNDWLVSEVGKLVKKDPKRFVEVLTDPDYKIKLFIEMGVSKKQIIKSKGKYSTKDGEDLCEEGEVPTLMNAIRFLNSIKNQETKLAIEAGY